MAANLSPPKSLSSVISRSRFWQSASSVFSFTVTCWRVSFTKMAWRPLPPLDYNLADESRQGIEGLPHHLRVVYQHCQWKGLQAGSLLGLAVGTPVLYFKGNRGRLLASRAITVAGIGGVSCFFFSVAFWSWSVDRVKHCVYGRCDGDHRVCGLVIKP